MTEPRSLGHGSLQSLSDLLNANQRNLISQARLLMLVEQRLLSQLDDGLRHHLRVARCDDSTLVLIADDAAWATKIRFMADDILAILASMTNLPCPEQVKVRLAPNTDLELPKRQGFHNTNPELTAPNTPNPSPRSGLGIRTRKALNATALSLTNHRLSAVLRRIAASK